MGLDMYMYCNDRELTHEVQDTKWRARSGEIMYWRKANAIHNWFIERAEYSRGEDDCRPISLTVYDLRTLCDLCDEVLADNERAPELLPVTDGFFFGSQDYDDYYFEDIKYTSEKLHEILERIRPAEKLEVPEGQYSPKGWSGDYVYKHNDWLVEFRYHASW